MNNERKVCEFLWIIENYSYCWHKNGENLGSPMFKADETAWFLQLFPRGSNKFYKDHISLYLVRSSADDGPQYFDLEYELSIISKVGSVLNQILSRISLQKNFMTGETNIARLQEVLLSKRDDYLPQDTLRVLCKIWKTKGNFQETKQIVARTRIGIEHISFLHVIENFSSIEPNEKKTILTSSPSRSGLVLSTSLYYSNDSSCKGKIIVEIKPPRTAHTLTKCKISLMEKSGKAVECVKAYNRFDTTGDRQDIENLHLSLSRQNILSRKSLYLPDDKLSLQYECTFSTGIDYEKIEKSMHGLPKLNFNQTSDKEKSNVQYDDSEKLNPSALDELKSFYSNQLFTDIELKTKTKSFPAHKLVLGARSSVFQAMLTNDMREKNTDCIQIDDLDDGTVEQFLLFLYSDKLENLQWESAIKLYYAGDKYAIGKLKAMSSSFLVNNVTTSTASELLLLADTHNDSDFKKAVEDFIFEHEEEVFGSEEWINLIETNSILVSKTMCLKYKRK